MFRAVALPKVWLAAAAVGASMLVSPVVASDSAAANSAPRSTSLKSAVTPWNERPWSERRALVKRIHRSRIGRRDHPLRADNINDEEVREIEAVMLARHPGAVVNIGAVVNHCPCENGPACSEQVWVVAYRPEASLGLQLSRLDGRWQVGPLQRWWLRFDEFQQRPFPTGRSGDPELQAQLDAYLAEQTALYDSFPNCVGAGKG